MDSMQYQQGIYNTQQLDSNFLELRLQTSKVIKQAEDFLSAKRTYLVYDKALQQTKESTKQIGKALANDEGINGLLHILSLRINPHSIQGNFTREQYNDFIEMTRKELTEEIVNNCDEWEIADNKLNVIINTFLSFITTVLSRLIDNKERDSFNNQMRYETHSREIVADQKSSGVTDFVKGLGGK